MVEEPLWNCVKYLNAQPNHAPGRCLSQWVHVNLQSSQPAPINHRTWHDNDRDTIYFVDSIWLTAISIFARSQAIMIVCTVLESRQFLDKLPLHSYGLLTKHIFSLPELSFIIPITAELSVPRIYFIHYTSHIPLPIRGLSGIFISDRVVAREFESGQAILTERQIPMREIDILTEHAYNRPQSEIVVLRPCFAGRPRTPPRKIENVQLRGFLASLSEMFGADPEIFCALVPIFLRDSTSTRIAMEHFCDAWYWSRIPAVDDPEDSDDRSFLSPYKYAVFYMRRMLPLLNFDFKLAWWFSLSLEKPDLSSDVKRAIMRIAVLENLDWPLQNGFESELSRITSDSEADNFCQRLQSGFGEYISFPSHLWQRDYSSWAHLAIWHAADLSSSQDMAISYPLSIAEYLLTTVS